MMSGVVQNQDSYMKGKIAQRWYYDRVQPALKTRYRRVRQQTGRSYDFVSRTAAKTPSTSSSAWAATWRRPRRPSITCASRGHQGGCCIITCFRPFPAERDRRGACSTARRSPCSSGWTSPDAVEPAALRDQGGVLRCHDGHDGQAKITQHAADSSAARPAWAAATCAPATSSPSSTT